MENTFFQISLLAAFVAGTVALFAPCCITFLLPAYLGSVFKEKERVLLMTLVFGLGIFVVLLPAVLGVAVISRLLFRYHEAIYVFGGVVMLIVAAISFLGLKLPMPRLPGRSVSGKADVGSIFILGVFSGITSACCAPVLMGILTFALLSPSFFGSLLVGVFYVLGMVMPLLLISLFLSGKVEKLLILRKPVFTFQFLGKKRTLLLSNVIAGSIFLITGIVTLFLTYTGRLSMGNSEMFAKIIQQAGEYTNQYVGGNLLLNIAFFGFILFVLYKVLKKL